MIEFHCKNCGQKLSVQDQYSGKRVKCPKCVSIGFVPDNSVKIKFHCQNCGQSISVPQIYAGKKGKCPKCKNVVVVPTREATPAKSTSMVSFTCSMCDETIQVPETSIGKTIECPECGSYIETTSEGAQGMSDYSADEDLYEEGTEEYEDSEGVDRRIIVIISSVAAVVVVGLIILTAVLRFSRSRPDGRPEGLRIQRQVADTDSQSRTVTSDAKPIDPVVQEPPKEDALPIEPIVQEPSKKDISPQKPVSSEEKLYKQTMIAFRSDRDGYTEIYIMNPDGSGQRNLTKAPSSGEMWPSWSHDGTRIAFSGNRGIYVMNADGSQCRNLTNNPADDRYPLWSPDGTKIVYIAATGGQHRMYDIYVMNSEGSEIKNLTNDPARPPYPSWSPDGKKIACFLERDGDGSIYVMNADGSEQRRLGKTATKGRGGGSYIMGEGRSSWSPDGRMIAFILKKDVYVIRTDGSGLKRLVDNPTQEICACWSPDGRRIAFISIRGREQELHVMNSDGSEQEMLADYLVHDSLTWSPDGQKIAFTSNRDGNNEIYVIKADGSGLRNLTNNPANEDSPIWSPFLPSVAKEETQPTESIVQEAPPKPDSLGREPRVKLVQKFPPGKYEVIRTETSKGVAIVEDQTLTTNESQSKWSEIDASEPDASGLTTCIVKVTRIRRSDSSGSSYDTDEPDTLRGNTIAQIISKIMLNRKFVLKFGQSGNLVTASGVDRVWDDMTDEMAKVGPIAVQMIQQFRQMGLKVFLGLDYDIMPDQPVGAGALWHRIISENIPLVGAAKISTEYELRKIEQIPEGRIAHIILISNIEQDKSKRTQFGFTSLTVAKLNMKGKGEIQLNLDTGLMISSKMERDGDVEMSMITRGKNIATNLQLTQTTETTTRPAIGERQSKKIAPSEPLARKEEKSPTTSRTESPLIGKPAPSFTLQDLSGKRVSLSDFKGKVVILDFWATWCPPCVVEIPHFIVLYEQYKDQGFAVVGISTDRKGIGIVRSFAQKNRINYPILMADGRVRAAYGGIRAIPTTFIIDSAGIIRHQYVGYRDKSVFETAIKALLADTESQKSESKQTKEVPSHPETSVDYFNRGNTYFSKGQYDLVIPSHNCLILSDN